MTPFYKTALAAVATAIVAASCTETTDDLGVYDSSDAIHTATATFTCRSWSETLTAVRASSDKSYIGQITDPETQATLKADFAAQFHTFEDNILPPVGKIVTDKDGNLVCDDVHIRIFFQKYYGNSTAPFKMEVNELSMQPDRMMKEDSVYYTDVNLQNFVATSSELAERHPNISWPLRKMFTPLDYTEDDDVLTNSTHYNNINITLPTEYGQRILRLYRDHPEYFTSSYKFIRNVCPGFYFHLTDGNGAMIYVDVASLDLYYRYVQNGNDTISGLCRFSATGEVIQATSFTGGGNESLVNDMECTYLKSPAGIGTVIKLPVDEIYKGHERDSLSLASLSLMRYNATSDEREMTLTPCAAVAMIERSEVHKFFEKGYERNPRAYAVASLSSGYNVYSFSNIGRLIAYLRHKKKAQADATCGGDTAAYATAHPEWNEVMLVPVTVNRNNSGQVISITNDMSITSARLIGGRKGPSLSIQVVYSSYNK